MPRFRLLALLLPFALFACDGDPDPVDGGPDGSTVDAGPDDPPPPAPFEGVEETARFPIPGLSAQAHVVRTEMNVPHVYAENRLDMMRVYGFVMAEDRFFQMDLTRRLSEGTLSEIFGDAALDSDIENAMTGTRRMVELYLEGLDEEEGAELDAFAEGINAYIDAVRAGTAPAPRELELARPLLGARREADLMDPWDRRSVVATGVTVLYGTSFERGAIGRSRAFEGIDALFADMPDQALRREGLQRDIIEHVAPPRSTSSAAGWGLETADSTDEMLRDPRRIRRPVPQAAPLAERSALDRLEQRLERVFSRMNRNEDEGYGSNAWAVMGSATVDGASLLAGDGHLQLSVPSLFWQIGLDTMLMGQAEENTRIFGATIPGLPLIGVGTNGRIAWAQTAYFADVTDWFTETLILDANGLPTAAVFDGEERALTVVDEVYEVRNVPALESVGRTETLPRFMTFDGRMITSIEGRPTTADGALEPGESRVNLMGDWVIPADVDGDGVISAVSFYYGPFDGGTLLRAFRDFTMSDTVEDFRQAMRHFIGYGGSMIASDSAGSVVYSAYHAVPCRDYLPRDPETNAFTEGADPRMLMDGTQYGSWSIPLDDRGRVDEAAAASGGPRACAVPFDQWPQARNPSRQYVQHANNDPGNIATDNDLFDDPYYIGGPWIEGYRASRIVERLERAIAEDRASIAEMAAMQGGHHSNLGEEWVPFLFEVLDAARDAADGSPADGTPEARMAARWAAASADYEEVERRIRAWQTADFPTPSGVETFYHTPAEGDLEHSVATMLFNAWFPRFLGGTLNDEGIPRALSPAVTGNTFEMQTILMLVQGRGAENPLDLGSFNPETGESVFFDDVRTPDIVESSQEIGLRALDEALAFLRSEPTGAGEGGFGSENFDDWRWGLRHMVRFDSLIGSFLGDADGLGVLFDAFNINTARLPLAASFESGDPRANLPYFPRPADQFDIDAANAGLGGGPRFSHGSGPVFRLVIALGPEGVRGQNIVPGGQSGLPASPHFDDQAQLWLQNETIPIRYLPAEVADGATSRQRFVPAP